MNPVVHNTELSPDIYEFIDFNRFSFPTCMSLHVSLHVHIYTCISVLNMSPIAL